MWPAAPTEPNRQTSALRVDRLRVFTSTALLFATSFGCRLVPVERDDENSAKTSQSPQKSTDSSNKESKPSSGKSEDQESSNQGPTEDQPNSSMTKSTGGETDLDTNKSTSTSEKNNGTQDCQEGRNRECFQTENGDIIHYPGSIVQGSCVPGSQSCENGKWGKCIGAVAPKKQDLCEEGNDDNCNGIPMDHCDCTPGDKKKCGSDVGKCKKGEVTCLENGKWSTECVGEVKPSKEICDELADENCDGKTDRENCECVVGDKLECGKWNLGICQPGYYPCTKQGEWDKRKCLDEIKPRQEICDGRGNDEDCDGAADLDDPDCECINQKETTCERSGLGDCSLGKKKCVHGKWGACEPRFSRQNETCGHLQDKWGPATGDEDCDGKIDENDGGRPPSGCTIWMLDADGDGYGALGSKFAGSHRPGTWGCFCENDTTTRPKGWVADTLGKHNSDCGDCEQDGSGINPGVKGFFVTPSQCLKRLKWQGGEFDYDCNKTIETRKGALVPYACELTNSRCLERPGWSGDIRCGGSGSWVSGICPQAPSQTSSGPVCEVHNLGFEEEPIDCH